MKKFIVVSLLNILSLFSVFCLADESNADTVKTTVEKLSIAVKNIKNLSAKIEYIHSQPLFETQTIRTGKIFYLKDVNSSAARINFLTLKQDEAKEQNYREDYIFDGITITKIDYQSKSATSEQVAEENKIEPFELVENYFPIIGLAKPEELEQQFDIIFQKKTNKQNPNVLVLTPKEGSKFFQTYRQIEIKIDCKSFLPFEFSATTCEDEQIIIRLTHIDTSAGIKNNVFEVVIPDDFVRTEK
jgi:outer membrane lipoprotein-sorting protein